MGGGEKKRKKGMGTTKKRKRKEIVRRVRKGEKQSDRNRKVGRWTKVKRRKIERK